MPQPAEIVDQDGILARFDAASRLASDGSLEEAAELYSGVIERLPRDGSSQDALVHAYERLMALRLQQNLEARAFRVLQQYVRDCAPACDPQYDQEYREALRITRSHPVPLRRRERFHSLLQLFAGVQGLDGLVAECGCFRGLSSYLLCRSLKRADEAFNGRGYRIFDSFAGLSPPQAEDAIDTADPDAERLESMTQPGKFAATLESVKHALHEFPGIEFFSGWIPGTFPDEPKARYRFVHVDVDLYQPTLDCLEYFYPRLVPGGRIISDDYAWPGARKAIEEYCARFGIEVTTNRHKQAWIERKA